jgi:phenylpropionate dioxygenase-like ring-hydroxylating dioxygenase large terminal subunit
MPIEPEQFARPGAIVAGWYWALPSSRLRRGRVRAVNLMGRELAFYRGEDGAVAALDAYCRHMGAHLAEGKVEGNSLRCFFHNWRYDATGRCTDIPCLSELPGKTIRIPGWPVTERHGLIWVWCGGTPTTGVPEIPELAGQPVDFALANRFRKRCHPNVVMINAIDEQHFHTVHHLPGSILQMQPTIVDTHTIHFDNQGAAPRSSRLGRFIARFYRETLYYSLSYSFGHVGTVSLGPDCLHLHLMFALRQTAGGETEGQTIVFTKHRPGLLGWLFNRLILALTRLAGGYFASGDTRVFQTIRFNFATPIAADRAVAAFIRHYEEQPRATWHEYPSGQARTGAGRLLTPDDNT